METFFFLPFRASSSSCPFSSRNAESQRQERKWRGRNLGRDSTAVRNNNFEHILYIYLHVRYSMLHFPTFGEFSQSAPLVALYSQKVFSPSSSLCCSLRTALRRRQEKVGGGRGTEGETKGGRKGELVHAQFTSRCSLDFSFLPFLLLPLLR